MIRSVDPSLPPSVLDVVWAMGHGDEVAVLDSHFVADWDEEAGIRGEIVKVDGMDSPRMVRAILSALQLDTNFVDYPVKRLESGRPDLLPDGHREVQEVLDQALGFPCSMLDVAYPEFFELAKNCFALIVTGGAGRRGSFILRKGLDVTPDTVCSTD